VLGIRISDPKSTVEHPYPFFRGGPRGQPKIDLMEKLPHGLSIYIYNEHGIPLNPNIFVLVEFIEFILASIKTSILYTLLILPDE